MQKINPNIRPINNPINENKNIKFGIKINQNALLLFSLINFVPIMLITFNPINNKKK